jgi:apolipoprotein N-acyltransferase
MLEPRTLAGDAPTRDRQQTGSTAPSPPKRSRRLPLARGAAALAAGAAVGFAFPPFDQVELMPLGVAGLLLLIRGRSVRAGLALGWAFGCGFMLVLLPWLRVIGYDAWIVLSLIEGLFYGAMGLTWSLLTRRRWWPAAVPATWVGAELLRSTVPFGGLPWGRLAYGLVETPVDRYGRIGGSGLVAFVVVLVVALAVDAVVSRRLTRWVAAEACLAVFLVAVSFALPVGLAGATGTSVRIAAVQGNVPGQGLEVDVEQRAVVRNHALATEAFGRKVRGGAVPRPRFVVWPENSSDIDPFDHPATYGEINRAVRAVGVPVLIGAVLDGPDADHVQNVGIVWSPTSGPGERYVKQHLVPFGEYIPFRDLLTRFIHRLDQIPRDFAPGDKVGRLTIAGVPIGDLMCFEVAYDGLVRSIVGHGAQVVVVQTNNATYAGTGQLDQQFAISRYQAIESGRDVVVASTDGISGFLSASGDVLGRSAVHTQIVMEQQVPLADGVTWGIRLGFWVDLALALAGLSVTAVAGLGERRRPGKMAS